MKWVGIFFINAYQKWNRDNKLLVECNFQPSCSEYSKQALQRFGFLKGLNLTLKRLRRCNNPDAVDIVDDPIPEVA